MHTDQELLGAARAVAAQDEDVAGVATYLAVTNRVGASSWLDGAASHAASAGDARLAEELRRAWAVVSRADPDATVQDALAALAWLHLREPGTDEPPVGRDEAPGATEALAAWTPEGVERGSREEREADVASVHDALVAGRVLRVVNFHHTPERDADAIRAQLSWFAERFVPATAADVHRLLTTGSWPHDRPGIAVALYDGFLSAARVAVPICEDLGLTAWLYPVTDLLDADVDRQREIMADRDFGVSPEDLASGQRLAMTWDELADLAERHVVLGHTDDHVTAASVTTDADVERRVRTPLRHLRERLGRDVAGWAWAGGTPLGDGPGDRALADEGVPLLVSNAFVERIG